MDTDQAVLTKGSMMLFGVYDSSLPSPRTDTSPIKVTRSGVLGKSKTVIFSSVGAPKFSGSITERHGDNILQRN
jgi:hypothetical protein